MRGEGREAREDERGRDTRRERRVAREREKTRIRECNVAGCASYIEAQEGSRRSEEAE